MLKKGKKGNIKSSEFSLRYKLFLNSDTYLTWMVGEVWKMKKTKTKIISTDKSLSLYEIGVSLLYVTLPILLQFYFLLLVHMYDSHAVWSG